jgi:hypothetical protein
VNCFTPVLKEKTDDAYPHDAGGGQLILIAAS